MFRLSNEGIPESSELIEGDIQFHETISVANNLLMEEEHDKYLVSNDPRLRHEVSIGGYGKGAFIVSDDFGSCQAVVARLKDGNFAVYHALTAMGNQQDSNFKSFVNSIKDEVKDVYVFQKPVPISNLLKAPALAWELYVALDRKVDVKRIHVEQGYHCVVADAKTNKIILAGEMQRVDPKLQRYEPSKKINVDISKAILIEQTKLELQESQKKGAFPSLDLTEDKHASARTPPSELKLSDVEVAIQVAEQKEDLIKRIQTEIHNNEEILKSGNYSLLCCFSFCCKSKESENIKTLTLCREFLKGGMDVSHFQNKLKNCKYSKGDSTDLISQFVDESIKVIRDISIIQSKHLVL